MSGRTLRAMAWGLVLLMGTSGCWYNTTGRSGANVGDIYIPFFADETAGRRALNLGVQLSEMVLEEFQQDRAIRVYQAESERDQAQKELLGRVRRISETVLTRNPAEQDEEYRVVVVCSITYRDLENDKILWQSESVSGDANYFLAEGDAGFDRAVQESLQKILDKILDQTIKAW